MKVLKTVAMLTVGFSLVGIGWCAMTVESQCNAVVNPAFCPSSGGGKCAVGKDGRCHAICSKLLIQSECTAVQVAGKPGCTWTGSACLAAAS